MKSARNETDGRYLAALEALLAPEEDDEGRRAFARAMEDVGRNDPDDAEARAWLAHSLFGLWPQGLPDGESLERIAALAESALAREPDHPGGLHYLVHALDSPERAWRALPAARRYAKVASRDSSHALHMPSHTFLQLGLFDEVISRASSPIRRYRLPRAGVGDARSRQPARGAPGRGLRRDGRCSSRRRWVSSSPRAQAEPIPRPPRSLPSGARRRPSGTSRGALVPSVCSNTARRFEELATLISIWMIR